MVVIRCRVADEMVALTVSKMAKKILEYRRAVHLAYHTQKEVIQPGQKMVLRAVLVVVENCSSRIEDFALQSTLTTWESVVQVVG